MTDIHVTLPDGLQAFVEEQVAQGGYGTASEYLRALVRNDQMRKARERLEALLIEGLPVENPGVFVQRLNRVLSRAV